MDAVTWPAQGQGHDIIRISIRYINLYNLNPAEYHVTPLLPLLQFSFFRFSPLSFNITFPTSSQKWLLFFMQLTLACLHTNQTYLPTCDFGVGSSSAAWASWCPCSKGPRGTRILGTISSQATDGRQSSDSLFTSARQWYKNQHSLNAIRDRGKDTVDTQQWMSSTAIAAPVQ